MLKSRVQAFMLRSSMIEEEKYQVESNKIQMTIPTEGTASALTSLFVLLPLDFLQFLCFQCISLLQDHLIQQTFVPIYSRVFEKMYLKLAMKKLRCTDISQLPGSNALHLAK